MVLETSIVLPTQKGTQLRDHSVGPLWFSTVS